MLIAGLGDLYHLGRRRTLNTKTLCASATPELAAELTQIAALNHTKPTVIADHILTAAERQIAASLHSEGRTATEAVELAELITATDTTPASTPAASRVPAADSHAPSTP